MISQCIKVAYIVADSCIGFERIAAIAEIASFGITMLKLMFGGHA